MASLLLGAVTRKYPRERDEEKDLRVSLKHYDRILAKSAGLGDYLSSIQHAHTCLLLHNRLVDIHLTRQKDKAEKARQRGYSSKVAHHLLKIRQIEAKKLAVPAFIHPDYKQLTEGQEISLAAEGSSALVPTASPQNHSPAHTSPHNTAPQQQRQHQQQYQQQQQSQKQNQQQSGSKRADDNVLYLLQHQMAAISANDQQQQQQPAGTQDIIRRLQHQATLSAPQSTRQSSAPPLQPGQPPSDTPNPRPSPRQPLPPPAYQPPTHHGPTSPVSPQQSTNSSAEQRRTRTEYGRREGGGEMVEEREGESSREQNGYNRQGEGQTTSGPVVMLQGERGRSAGEAGRETGATNEHDKRGAVWNGGSPQSGKEEKQDREEGEGQRETTSGPVVMLHAR